MSVVQGTTHSALPYYTYEYTRTMFCCLSMWYTCTYKVLCPTPRCASSFSYSFPHRRSDQCQWRWVSLLHSIIHLSCILMHNSTNKVAHSILFVCSCHHFSRVCAAPRLCFVGWHHWSTNGPGIQKEEEGSIYVVSGRKKLPSDLALLACYLAYRLRTPQSSSLSRIN